MFVIHAIHIPFNAKFRINAHLNHLKFNDPKNMIPYLSEGRLNEIEITAMKFCNLKLKRPSETHHSEIYYSYRSFKKYYQCCLVQIFSKN